MSRTRYDWQQIEMEYVTGKGTMREVAEAHNIPFSTFSKHAKEARFTEKRKKYGEKVMTKARARESSDDARALRGVMTGIRRLIRIANKHGVNEDTILGYIVETEDGGEKLVHLPKADTKALRNIAGMYRDIAVTVKTIFPDGDGDGKNDEEHSGVVLMPDRD